MTPGSALSVEARVAAARFRGPSEWERRAFPALVLGVDLKGLDDWNVAEMVARSETGTRIPAPPRAYRGGSACRIRLLVQEIGTRIRSLTPFIRAMAMPFGNKGDFFTGECRN